MAWLFILGPYLFKVEYCVGTVSTPIYLRSYQGDVAFDNFGPQQQTALTDLVVTHPTAATSSYRTGQSGVAAATQERIKEGKYNEAAAAKGIRFIPFAMETYGKLGTKALRLLRTLGQGLADSNQPSALRPWHAPRRSGVAEQWSSGAFPGGLLRPVWDPAGVG